jgi:nucleoid DNA-binding protein
MPCSRENPYLYENLEHFIYKEYPARNGRNPSTGETIMIPPGKVVRFKIKPEHKDLIGKGKKNSNKL